MSWKKKVGGGPAPHPLVPEWYAKAREQGASRAELRAQVESFCKQALAYRAANAGTPVTDETPDPAWVDQMQAMYEAGFAESLEDSE